MKKEPETQRRDRRMLSSGSYIGVLREFDEFQDTTNEFQGLDYEHNNG